MAHEEKMEEIDNVEVEALTEGDLEEVRRRCPDLLGHQLLQRLSPVVAAPSRR